MENFSFTITLTRDQLEFVRTGLQEAGLIIDGDKGVSIYRGVKFDYEYVGFQGNPKFDLGTLTLTIASKSFLAKMLSDSYIESEVRGMVVTYLASMPIRKPTDPTPPTNGPIGGKAA